MRFVLASLVSMCVLSPVLAQQKKVTGQLTKKRKRPTKTPSKHCTNAEPIWLSMVSRRPTNRTMGIAVPARTK